MLDPELFVILEKKVIPLLNADLKILLYLLDVDASLAFDDSPVVTELLKTKPNWLRIFGEI